MSLISRQDRPQIFLGTFIHCVDSTTLVYLVDTIVCVDAAGIIVAIEQDCDQRRAKDYWIPLLRWAEDTVIWHEAREGDFYFPGFIGESGKDWRYLLLMKL